MQKQIPSQSPSQENGTNDDAAQESKEVVESAVRIVPKFVGEGGPHMPVRVQVNLGSQQSIEVDVDPKNPQPITLQLPPGQHFIDARPLLKQGDAYQVEYRSMTQQAGFNTFRLETDSGFTRYESGLLLDVKQDTQFTLSIEPTITLSNLAAKIGNDARAWYLRGESIALPQDTEQKSQEGSFSMVSEQNGELFPFTMRLYRITEDNGARKVALVRSIKSDDGSIPQLDAQASNLEPGTYVFNVIANRPHYTQPSLITLNNEKEKIHKRQIHIIGTPVDVKAGQQVTITIEQPNKPYNTSVGEFQAAEGLPTVRVRAIFPRGYPSMGDIDFENDTREKVIADKSDLLRLHTEGKKTFVGKQVEAVMNTLFDADKQNVSEWRASFILYTRPGKDGKVSDNLRGMSIEEYNALDANEQEAHRDIIRTRLTEFVEELLEDNLRQPYRSENAAALLQAAKQDLGDDSIVVQPRHMNKQDAIDQFAQPYIDKLQEKRE